MNMSIDEWFHMDEFHPWLEDKWIQNYLYPSSFVVQILTSQTWMSFNNDG
jgi:hypothetical protein